MGLELILSFSSRETNALPATGYYLPDAILQFSIRRTVMPKKKSVQNQKLTDEEVMKCFLAMEHYQNKINERKTEIAKLHIQFEHFAKNTQEQRRLMGEISERIRLNEKAKKSRFELFLKLIVRLRNQFTKKGTYTKRHFLVEVKRYLDTTEFTVR